VIFRRKNLEFLQVFSSYPKVDINSSTRSKYKFTINRLTLSLNFK